VGQLLRKSLYSQRLKLTRSLSRVSNIRGHLAAAVAPKDQILLLGPPYKVPKNSALQSDEVLNSLRLGDMEDEKVEMTMNMRHTTPFERSGAMRLFLFSKQALSENAPDPPVCKLEPMEVNIPQMAPDPSPFPINPSSSPPLHQALVAYERQFMLALAQGRQLADASDMRLKACRDCVQEQIIMTRALQAAVANLSDHFQGATRTRAEFSADFQAKTAAHSNLLQNFDSILGNISNISLDASLVAIARSAGRNYDSLLDTVPVEKERSWAAQCRTSHQRLLNIFAEVNTSFDELGTPSSREEELRGDLEAQRELLSSVYPRVESEAKTIRNDQCSRLDRLTSAHREGLKIVTMALNSNDEDEIQRAFTPLREMSDSCKAIVPLMLEDDKRLQAIMIFVGNTKTKSMKRLEVRLREISLSQSSIQRVLSSVAVLKDALNQQIDNVVHLEHVAELAESYRAFLSEVQRRRAYGRAVQASSTAMIERLAGMREDEVNAREQFLRGPGRHLMPAFFDLFVPTLATPPPLFTPQMPALVELDTLPSMGVTSGTSSLQATAAVDSNDISSASTLTTESQPVQQLSSVQEETTNTDSDQQGDQIIVSAEEQTAVLLNPSTSSNDDANLKTLAYENLVLRQALEKLGGKPPRIYIEQAKEREVSSAHDRSEIDRLQNELAALKPEAAAGRKQISTGCGDKISHSSFNIGDVGLFMPTGRGSGGKRMYLAFHTNCPHRYLSTDCIKGSPDFVLGRIVYQEELIAGEVGTDANPYGLHKGTKFWVLTVELLKPSLKY